MKNVIFDRYDLWSLRCVICRPSLFILAHHKGFLAMRFFFLFLNFTEIEAEETRFPWIFSFFGLFIFLLMIRLDVFVRVKRIKVIIWGNFLEFWAVWLIKWYKVSKLSGRTWFGCNLRVFSFGCEEVLEGHWRYVKLMIIILMLYIANE